MFTTSHVQSQVSIISEFGEKITMNTLTSDYNYTDDVDDLSLILPTGPSEYFGASGLMDLTGFTVQNNVTHIFFNTTFVYLDNSYENPLGFSNTYPIVYVDYKAGGTNEPVLGEDVVTSGSWDMGLGSNGFSIVVYYSNTTTKTNPVGASAFGDLSTNTVVFTIPTTLFGSLPTDDWEYYVLVGMDWFGYFREADPTAGEWMLGSTLR